MSYKFDDYTKGRGWYKNGSYYDPHEDEPEETEEYSEYEPDEEDLREAKYEQMKEALKSEGLW